MPQNTGLDLLSDYGEKTSRRSMREEGRFLVLTRHFFHRLFLNNTVFLEEQMMEKVIGVVAVLAFCLVPLFLALFAFYSLVWEYQAAARHCLYAFVFAVALMEGLFFRHRKIPFACSYLPGKGKIHVFGVVYLGFFLAYTAVPVWAQDYILARPSRFAVLCGVVLVMILSFRIYETFVFYRKRGILYEEHPAPVMADYFSSV